MLEPAKTNAVCLSNPDNAAAAGAFQVKVRRDDQYTHQHMLHI